MSLTKRSGANVLRLIEQAADEPGATREVFLYGKDVGGDTQLFAVSSAGDVNRLTPAGITNLAESLGSVNDPTIVGGPATMPDMSVVLTTTEAASRVLVFWYSAMEVQQGDNVIMQLQSDGSPIGEFAEVQGANIGGIAVIRSTATLVAFATGLTPGAHTFSCEWDSPAGTGRGVGKERGIIAMEIS